MKVSFVALATVVLFSACRKDLAVKESSINAEMVSSDALAPLPCHSTSFVTNYAIKPGEVPPFRFNKTLYSDTRVKTINMLSRVYSNHYMLRKQAYELIGTFTYSVNMAYFKGTRETWEYFVAPDGSAGKRSLAKVPIQYTFLFDDGGHCQVVTTNGKTSLEILYYDYAEVPKAIERIEVYANEGDRYKLYMSKLDSHGNVLGYEFPYADDARSSNVAYTYDYSKPASDKNNNYTPSQNLISQEFSILEAMQWVPSTTTHERKTVSGIFYPQQTIGGGPSNFRIVQTQTYKNYKYDSKGNLLSYTYVDNVLQKTTWFCK